MKLTITTVFISLLLVAMVTGCDGSKQDRQQAGSEGAGRQQAAPAAEVGYIELRAVETTLTNELPGRVVSYREAEIRPQVSGIIQSLMFEEGSYVEAGQPLYQIDPARYRADYDRAKAGLKDARALRDKARLDFNRFKALLADNAISRQQYDEALSQLNQTEAAVGLAEAEVERAKIELDDTLVRAPIDGYIGPSAATEGALVATRQELALATVRQLDPVYVDLSRAEVEARLLRKQLTEIRANQRDKTELSVTLYPGNSSRSYPHKGKLDAADLAVDPRTGAIRLRAVFPNPDRVLLPGMFVRASIEGAGQSREIVIPQKSVHIGPDGNKSVWVIGADDKADKRFLRTGAVYGNHWVVLNGLEVGDRLIVEGTMKLREGAAVKPEKIKGYYEELETEVPPATLKQRAPPPEDPPPSSREQADRQSAGDAEVCDKRYS